MAEQNVPLIPPAEFAHLTGLITPAWLTENNLPDPLEQVSGNAGQDARARAADELHKVWTIIEQGYVTFRLLEVPKDETDYTFNVPIDTSSSEFIPHDEKPLLPINGVRSFNLVAFFNTAYYKRKIIRSSSYDQKAIVAIEFNLRSCLSNHIWRKKTTDIARLCDIKEALIRDIKQAAEGDDMRMRAFAKDAMIYAIMDNSNCYFVRTGLGYNAAGERTSTGDDVVFENPFIHRVGTRANLAKHDSATQADFKPYELDSYQKPTEVALSGLCIAIINLFKTKYHYTDTNKLQTQKLMRIFHNDINDDVLRIVVRSVNHSLKMKAKTDYAIANMSDEAYRIRMCGYGAGNEKAGILAAIMETAKIRPGVAFIVSEFPQNVINEMSRAAKVKRALIRRPFDSMRFCENSNHLVGSPKITIPTTESMAYAKYLRALCDAMGGTIAQNKIIPAAETGAEYEYLKLKERYAYIIGVGDRVNFKKIKC